MKIELQAWRRDYYPAASEATNGVSEARPREPAGLSTKRFRLTTRDQ
jgi:hypothetical protein